MDPDRHRTSYFESEFNAGLIYGLGQQIWKMSPDPIYVDYIHSYTYDEAILKHKGLFSPMKTQQKTDPLFELPGDLFEL